MNAPAAAGLIGSAAVPVGTSYDVADDQLSCPPAPGRWSVPGRHAWFPLSPCGDGCVRAPRRVGRIRAAWRLMSVMMLTLVLAVVAPLIWIGPRLLRRRMVRVSAHAMLRALGATVVIDDRRPFVSHTRGLVVANHVSYLDIAAVAMISPAHFVAKSEVDAIPGISTLARLFGVIGIERNALRALPSTLAQAVDRLEHDTSVAVFPEGTTRCGRVSGVFAPAFFAAAIEAKVPVIPVRIDFRTPEGTCTAAAFIGEDSPLDTLRRVVGVRDLEVVVTVHESQLPSREHADLCARRRELARRCQELVFGGAASADPL